MTRWHLIRTRSAPDARSSTAAGGAAAAVAASAAAPLTVSAVESPMHTEYNNQTTDLTSITNTGAGTGGFGVSNIGDGTQRCLSGLPPARRARPPDVHRMHLAGSGEHRDRFRRGQPGSTAGPNWATTHTGVYGWDPTLPTVDRLLARRLGRQRGHRCRGHRAASACEGDGFYGMVAAGANDPASVRAARSRGWRRDSGNDIALDVRGKAKFSQVRARPRSVPESPASRSTWSA